MQKIKEKISLVLVILGGCFLMSAVSYENANPNEVIEEELKKLNSSIEKLIILTECHNDKFKELTDIQIKILHNIFISLQPNAFDMNGNLIED